MSTTPISGSNRGHAVTINGVNFTEYLTVHERGPFVLYQVARDLELKLAEAVRLGDRLRGLVVQVEEGPEYFLKCCGEAETAWEAFKASSLKGGAA